MDSLNPPPLDRNDGDADRIFITVRFSASLPDQLLTIDNPATSTAATLKQLIRQQLPSDLSDRRIRLIHAGRALVDTTPLSVSLRLSPTSRLGTPSQTPTPVPPPPRNNDHDVKGKAPVYDPPALTRIYIHCSIGDVTLSPSDLATEASEAIVLTSSSQATNDDSTAASAAAAQKASEAIGTSSTTTPAPRGFDRLISAGFTPDEIRTLRSQFMAIQAHSHTPDTMPSPSTLRAMEDRWLDNDTSTGSDLPGQNNGAGATGVPAMVDEDAAGALDDLLWGGMMGFFWPVGCLWWVCREEGVWSRRKRWAVVVGCLVNAAVGGLRWLS